MKPLHIIIDSGDKMGKTTLLRELSKKLNLPVIKMPNMPEYIDKGQTEEFSKLFNETLIQFKDTSFILDRGFTSSLVYSKVFNRTFDLSYIDEIERILEPKVFIIIGKPFCQDEIFNPEIQEKVNDEFLKLAKQREYVLITNANRTTSEMVANITKLL